MFLDKLSLIGFKNIAREELEFTSRINCFTGDNGAGKTNILDAVHYLAICKSAFGMTDSQSVRHGEEFFMLQGHYRNQGGRIENIVCSFKRGAGKVLKRNGKEYERLSEHIGLIPVVTVSPSDSLLITDAAEERRRFLNSFLSQTDRTYLKTIVRYNQLLAQRNRLLKTGVDSDIMEVLDMQLAEAASLIYDTRETLTGKLAPLVEEFYCLLSGDREQVQIHYRSELSDRTMAEILSSNREKDIICQYTTGGIHRDDIKMKIGGYPLRKYGSQGQQKSFLVAMKLAQYVLLSRQCGEKPLLLLDDLFDKLDMERVGHLLEIVSEEQFGQIFITDCNKVRLQSILDRGKAEYSLFPVREGKIEQS